MELLWLKTFADAAETLNFRKTSERLLMSQPSVTVHIRLLEEALGVKLFKREKNRVLLTAEGRLFKEETRHILRQLESSIQRIQAHAQGFRRKWTLAISPLMAETLLPYVLRTFTRDHPNLELSIRVEESVYIEALIESGEVDAGVSALPAQSRKVEQVRLYDDPLLFAVPRDAYDDESGPAIEPEELLGSHYLFTGHHPFVWEELLPKLRKTVPKIRTMEVTQAHIVKRFIQEGLGVSFLPRSTVRRELIEGRLQEVPFSRFQLPQASAYLLTKERNSLEEEFIRRIQSIHFV